MRRALAIAIVAGCSSREAPAVKRDPAPAVAMRDAVPPDAVPPDAAAGVRLVDGLSIETYGGASAVILPRGTALPAEHREAFTTAHDDQASVQIHMLAGDAPRVGDNRSIGRFQLHGIAPGPRGVPQIDVAFRVDAGGNLTVVAVDRASGRQREMRVTGPAARLDATAAPAD